MKLRPFLVGNDVNMKTGERVVSVLLDKSMSETYLTKEDALLLLEDLETAIKRLED